MAHSLPALPYDAAALEPHIDATTMQIHHGKHHQAYVTNLNAALDKHPELHNKSLDDLVKHLGSVPEDIRTAVRNNGGGHWNHAMFWQLMAPNAGGAPTGDVASGINAANSISRSPSAVSTRQWRPWLATTRPARQSALPAVAPALGGLAMRVGFLLVQSHGPVRFSLPGAHRRAWRSRCRWTRSRPRHAC